MAKPCHLAFRVLPGGALRRRDGGFQRHLAAQVQHELGHAERLHRRQIRIETAGGQRGHLGQRARFDHADKTGLASSV